MKKVILYMLPIFALLSGCSKTQDLYRYDEYNSYNFDANYYTDFDGLDTLTLQEINHENVIYTNPNGSFINYGENKNLGKEHDGFRHGVLSKLYDGRTWCNGLYQLSRVQLNKTGFGTKLPTTLKAGNKFEFAARGGTSPSISKLDLSNRDLTFNFVISFYTDQKIINYKVDNIVLPTDKGGDTAIISINLESDVVGAIGYSMTWSCVTLPNNTSDDYKDNEKDHLAVMLYEVMMPGSSW